MHPGLRSIITDFIPHQPVFENLEKSDKVRPDLDAVKKPKKDLLNLNFLKESDLFISLVKM